MSTSSTKVLRCAACKKKIRPHHPDLILEDIATGRRRFYHEWCSAAAYARAASRPGVYVLFVRHVELAVN